MVEWLKRATATADAGVNGSSYMVFSLVVALDAGERFLTGLLGGEGREGEGRGKEKRKAKPAIGQQRRLPVVVSTSLQAPARVEVGEGEPFDGRGA